MNLRKTCIKSTVLSVSLLLIFSFKTFAQAPEIKENSRELKVKYLDGDNNTLFFNLKYNNDSGNDFKLMVLGESGEVLFQNNYSGKKIRKVLRLPRLTDTDGVTFLIRPAKADKQLLCKVKVPNKVSEEGTEESED